jgi:hypothetical protein
VAGFCEHGNERSGSIKSMEFLDCLSDSKLLKDLLHGLGPLISLVAMCDVHKEYVASNWRTFISARNHSCLATNKMKCLDLPGTSK